MDKEEAIKILRELHDKVLFSERTALETLHPELKESEDERIRKSLTILLQHFCKGYRVPGLDFPVSYKDMLTWLEKQGEQKLPIEKLPEEMKTIGESLGFTTQEECDEYNKMVSDIIMSADKVEPKFKVGDWIIDDKNRVGIIVRILDEHYIISFDGREVQISFEWEGKLFRKWSIKDAKDGDVLREDSCTFIIERMKPNGTAIIHCCLFDDGDFDSGSTLSFDIDSTKPATKEQRDLLFQKMKEKGYMWDAEKKELKKIELSDVGHEYYSELLKNDTSDNIADYAYQCVYCMSHDWAIENPTWDNVQSACRLGAKWQKKHDVSEDWSEEDEKMIGRVRGIIEAYAFSQSAVDVNGDLCEKKFIDVDIWLKSIKYRYTWKPSDAQMRALEYIINNAHNTSYSCKIAKELLEQLRRLKGE